MKKLLCISAGLAMAFSAAAAMAADVTGTWTATMQSPDGGGGMQLTFTFKQDGATVTGSVAMPGGDPITISNGKADGDKFTFDVSFNGMTIHHDCTVSGDEIKMTTKSDSGDFPGMSMTLKRAQGTPPSAPASAPAPPAAMTSASTPSAAMAADVTGTWTGDASTPDGNSFQLTYSFKQDGAKLTGTVLGPQGDPLDISNGKIDGGKFSFDIAFNGMTIHNDGAVDGEQIKLTSKTDSPDFPGMTMTLKRATPMPAAPTPPAAKTATPQ